MKTLHFNPVNKIRQKLLSIQSDPNKVIYGFALGIFLSATPLIGVKVFIGILITYLLRWNKIACIVGVMHINGITGPAFYGLAYFIGQWVCRFETGASLPSSFSIGEMVAFLTCSWQVVVAMTVGSTLLSIPMTIGAYYFSKMLLQRKAALAA